MAARLQQCDPLAERLQAFVIADLGKNGGARAWRLECAAILTLLHRRALRGAAMDESTHRACGGRTATDLAYRFVKQAASDFKVSKKSSWWPWVALSIGLLGLSVAELRHLVRRIHHKWALILLDVYERAVTKFSLESVSPETESSTTGAASQDSSPASKRPFLHSLGDADSELVRLLGVTESDPHEVLALGRRPGADVIRRRYLALARMVHPDKNSHPQADIAFRKLHHAYELCLALQRRW